VAVKLGPGDLVEVGVYGVPELTTKGRITGGGDMYLPLVDNVHLGGLTLEEAQGVIEKRLADGGFVKNPHVMLTLSESVTQGVTLLGEVAKPGVYQVAGERRLYDLISSAGGFTEKAGRSVTITHREHPDAPLKVELPNNLADSNQGNVVVAPGDTVVVAKAGVVYVVGDVGRPSGILIEDNNLTVLKALALAGGTTRTSSLNGARLLRQTPTGVQEIPVPLKKIMEAKAHDEAMVKGDVLFVPGSAAKGLMYKGVDAALSMTTALTVLAVQ
jgi:polysaccharide export outer membrane protein